MTKQRTNHSFAEAVKRGQAICYEFVPPSQSLSEEKLRGYFSDLATGLAPYPVSAIMLPEVIEEENRADNEKRSVTAKLTPRVIASRLQAYNTSEPLIARPIVYLPWEEQKKWLEESSSEDIKNVILVGGDSSAKKYPGLSVTAAAREITHNFPSFFLGGITIPTRKHEAVRVAKKSLAGIQFFTTQILYESDAIKQLLKDYWDLCQRGEAEARMIILSFAPMTTLSNIQFMQSLGVAIPEETVYKLNEDTESIEDTSLQICENILKDILHYTKTEHIAIPLGLSIGHVTRANFGASIKLLDRLSTVYLENTSSVIEGRQQGYPTFTHIS